VTLRDIDDLQAVVARNLSSRAAEVPRAEIVEPRRSSASRAGSASSTCARRSRAARARRGDRRAGARRERGRWESASPRDLARVEALARAVASRLLHEPTIRLRSARGGAATAASSCCASCSRCRDSASRRAASALPQLGAAHDRERSDNVRPAAARPQRVSGPAAPAQARHARQPAGARAGGAGRRGDRRAGRARACCDERRRGASPGGDKRRWVDRIEDALCAGEIDLAVHSAKDLPGELADGLEIAGAPPARTRATRSAARRRSRRCRPEPASARAACAAPRSCARCARTRGSCRSPATSTRGCGARGGGDSTRSCSRAPGSSGSGASAARAGRARAGGGQGTLAIEARVGDARVATAIAALRHAPTERALSAERALARALGADCDTPIGAHARLARRLLELRAFVGAPTDRPGCATALAATDPSRSAKRSPSGCAASAPRSCLSGA
jgi:hydroxymethylbilane synthase